MYKIAHITDTHIKYNNPEPNNTTFRQLLENAVVKNGCSHILLSGDISDYADVRDYEEVRKILSEYNLLNTENLSVVPGNHDIYGGPGPDLPFFMYPMHCKKTNYEEKIDQFREVFGEAFEGAEYDEGAKYFPYLKLPAEGVAVFGVNTIPGYSKRNMVGGNGYVDDKSLKKLKKLLRKKEVKNRVKIIVLHHHFHPSEYNKAHPEHGLWMKTEEWKLKMYGKGRMQKLFKKYGVDMILHGHTHLTDTYKMKGNLFINSSGCSMPCTVDGKREYYIVNIEEKKKGYGFNLDKITLE